MTKDNLPQPPEDPGGKEAAGATGEARDERDTDERFEDHPELAPDESRISAETVPDLQRESIRRRAGLEETGEAPVDPPPGRGPSESRGGFDRNDDFMGNEARLPTDADYSRGSGWLGGKLWGEDEVGANSGEDTPADEADPIGFQPSVDQIRNRQAIAGASPTGTSSVGDAPAGGNLQGTPGAESPEERSQEGAEGDLRTQGRDLGNREQATASQAFGRDVGASGLPGIDGQEDEADIIRRRAAARVNSGWASVSRRLGGSSPGSAENLQLTEKFNMIKFPSTREEVLQKLPPGSEFRIDDRVIDLREAVAECRLPVFRTTFDLIDCVKDAIRRAESLERDHA